MCSYSCFHLDVNKAVPARLAHLAKAMAGLVNTQRDSAECLAGCRGVRRQFVKMFLNQIARADHHGQWNVLIC